MTFVADGCMRRLHMQIVCAVEANCAIAFDWAIPARCEPCSQSPQQKA